ncbi:uroporphyrinogen-III synthase [Deinococcus sp. HMF7620]|uniref:Uroporphyrinogen-III synthase n=1 Tax=Deinococcus arboris TaxID=2682977 RepID=A0A7C9M7T0_9DEIO|nr:uroporphyrinogen-III synthase [Deinococcus arboris]MVN86379.1 uroporphyrinogen-III synthase [Deinococcus arboris]
MQALIRTYGGSPQVAPSMRERPLDLSSALALFQRHLLTGDIHAIVCQAGVGTRTFLQALAPTQLEALQNVPFLALGPISARVLSDFGLSRVQVTQPHLWPQVAEHLLATLSRGQHAVILEYGEAMPAALVRKLGAAGIRVTSLPVYHCAFPINPVPLAQAVRDVVLGGPDVLLLSRGTQLLHFLKYAERLGLQAEARAGLNRLVTVSIGPACSEAATDLGLRIDLEADPHTMTTLVRLAAEKAHGVLAQRLSRTG